MKSLKDTNIVCLGGGVGTVNLITGLKEFTDTITVVASTADDGGSAGRLRRFYSVPPPGDLISCIAALSHADPLFKSLLTFRFPGNRYGSDSSLPGHKFGNLMLVALTSLTGSFSQALIEMQKIFLTKGKILPATEESVSIWARTTVGESVYREENIDLGRFTGKIDRLYLTPSRPKASKEVLQSIESADLIIAGPGDFYTTILPVLLIPGILKKVIKSSAKKMYIVNVANKSYETPDFTIQDYENAIIKHCGMVIFNTFIVNNRYDPPIPRKYSKQYSYLKHKQGSKNLSYKVIETDLVDESFPLYHDPQKLAKTIAEAL